MTDSARRTIENEITVIHPYKYSGMWVFDDARVGLEREPFVAGADLMIDQIVASIPNAEEGFSMIFSRNQFPGSQYRLEWKRAESGGNVPRPPPGRADHRR